MNHGNFNGYTPNGQTPDNGYPPYTDTPPYPNNDNYNYNAYNNPSNNSYHTYPAYDNSSSPGYRPYEGGTYRTPNTSYQPQQTAYESSYSGYQNPPVINRNDSASSETFHGAISISDYCKRIFAWMGAGLTLTFVIAFAMMHFLTSGDILEKLTSFQTFFVISIITEVVLVIILSIFVRKLPYAASLILFIFYSVCNGITITPLLVVFGAENAIYAFAGAAVLFIAFAIYGMVTKRDLTKLGPILLIGLLVLLVYSGIAMLVGMSSSSLVVSLIGLVIFIGYTAYDTQKIRSGYRQFCQDEEMLKKSSVTLALELYLDFINIFIYLLRIMAKNR